MRTGFWQDDEKKKKKIKAERVLQDSKEILTFPFYPCAQAKDARLIFFPARGKMEKLKFYCYLVKHA
jgi:hypothetical protein